jgi:hypothetical protein
MATENSNRLKVSREARQLYILLWTLADDEGRIQGELRDVAGVLYPGDDDAETHVGSWLDELQTQKCIRRYRDVHTSLVAIADWRVGE